MIYFGVFVQLCENFHRNGLVPECKNYLCDILIDFVGKAYSFARKVLKMEIQSRRILIDVALNQLQTVLKRDNRYHTE